jgi:hypothetical protein
MKTEQVTAHLSRLKPDGHQNNPIADALHRMANEVQLMADASHAAITAVTSPTFKGDVIGELAQWPGHFPLELDHTEDGLNDIMVRGVSVSEHLAAGLWDEAESYIKERFGAEMFESTRRVIARMDAADLREARNA